MQINVSELWAKRQFSWNSVGEIERQAHPRSCHQHQIQQYSIDEMLPMEPPHLPDDLTETLEGDRWTPS